MRTYSMRIVVMLAGMVLVSACGNEPNSGRNTAEDSKTEARKDYTKEPAELVFFGVPAGPAEAWDEKVGNAMRKRFPDYKFTYIPRGGTNTLENFVATGTQVDIIQDSVGNSANSLIPTGLQYDLTELVKKHNVDLNRFEPATIEAVKQFGGLYGFPINNGGLVLYYNKDIFDKFGVAYPKDGMTWDEAIELGKKLTRSENGRQYIGLAASANHALGMSSYSLPFVDKATEKAAVNNDKYKAIVETLILAPAQNPGYKEKVASLKRTFLNDDFSKDQYIGMFVMNYGLQNNKEFDTFNWDMAALPVFKENPGVGTQPYPDFYFISQTSKYKDQAMEVLKFLTSDEFQMEMSKKGHVPVLKNESVKKAFAQDSKFKSKNVVNALFTNKYASPIARTKYDSRVNGPLLSHLAKVIVGEEDLNTALRSAEEEANKAIEAMKSK
ncbi:carbohydrate ABC transporter substrate-binding protein [Paenibacillus hemerocallicola]|uniref:Carbohydrate ABC transporter substrate-binding protein n=1 Tax=Paenibacillus hemerocallicola TaxID=1172614 RepID=A0A5C4T371_9BACL|nr:ABC transporter substrate-binding protein [Paenibacillus hemerocallicola]TNJ62717.1 carbohydrate ABC transporter substrate-binding protein [Paenibacillus hemerocallicola]